MVPNSVILVVGINTRNQRTYMTKQFNMEDFNLWVQDTQDYSMIETKDSYINRKSNDCITYCTKILGMVPVEAWKHANNIHISESKRLK